MNHIRLLLALAAIASLALAQTPQETAASLRAQIAHHDNLYYNKAAPEITDAQYDALKQQLATLETQHPELATPDSPTKRRAPDHHDSHFQSIPHQSPMLSLENTYNTKDLSTFTQRLQKQFPAQTLDYLVEPKIDGIAISLIYKNRNLTHALTRGNGSSGDDILPNLRHLHLPQTLPANAPNFIEIRGELYITPKDFTRINTTLADTGSSTYATPRNLAAGTAKLHSPAEAASRPLKIALYAVGNSTNLRLPDNTPVLTQADLHSLFRSWNLPAIETTFHAGNSTQLPASIEQLRLARQQLPYPTDGAVIKLNSLQLQQLAGTSTRAPRWAIAYKFSPERAETKLLSITLQVGRTGTLTPVAELAPVNIGGTTITRATLHNFDEIARKDLRPGDTVILEKAGEIIPAILSANLTQRPPNLPAYQLPDTCPSCQTKLTTTGASTRCPNENCPAQLQRQLLHFASRPCMNISGLGEKTIARLVSAKLLQTPADLYRLTEQQLIAAGISPKSAQQLLASINASKQQPLSRLILALGLPDTGSSTAQLLAQKYTTLAQFAAATESDLSQILPPQTARTLHQSLNTPKTKLLLHQLSQLLPSP